jgi:hypothetical protein
MLRPAFLVLLALTAFAAEEPVPTHLKVKASFSRPGKDGKSEVYAEPSVITVDGKQTTIRVGSADEGMVFTVTPKVGPDGFLTLDMTSSARVSGEPASPASPKPVVAKEGLPRFHGVLPKDKLFSIEDATGSRKWVPLGRKVDGWTLRAYDEKREALTLSRLGQSVELVLHKGTVGELAPTVRKEYPPLKTPPGMPFVVAGADGQPVTLQVEVLDLSK